MKVLICGDRNWSDRGRIREVLSELPANTVVVHGGAKGADSLAGEVAEELGFATRVYPYIGALGRAGGPARNRQMAEDNPDTALVIAFHPDLAKSKGTANMVKVVAPKHLPRARVRVIRR